MNRVTFDSREFRQVVVALRDKAPEALRNAGMAAALVISKHAIETKLIEANPPFLNRRTGTLVRSVSASPRSVLAGDRVIASFGSHLDYAYKHEVGGHFTEWIKGHRVRRYLRRAHAQRTFGGRRVWVGEAEIGSHWVKAHSVSRIYRRRRMFATALNEKREIVPALVRAALRLLGKTTEIPSAGAILAAAGGSR